MHLKTLFDLNSLFSRTNKRMMVDEEDIDEKNYEEFRQCIDIIDRIQNVLDRLIIRYKRD